MLGPVRGSLNFPSAGVVNYLTDLARVFPDISELSVVYVS